MEGPICSSANLNAYIPTIEMPWNQQRILHMFRRLMFGADQLSIKNAIGKNPISLVEAIINYAKIIPVSKEPTWAKWTLADYSPVESIRTNQIISQYQEWSLVWMKGMKNDGLRDKMTFFWHNHFVTKLEKYACPSWMYEYHKTLQKNALGNFKTFVKEMGKNPAMLVYLDGIQNTKIQPNENYARELFELFTLGVDNGYTQADIVDAARALSGYNGLDESNFCGQIKFVPLLWDSGQKTIFGKTGNYNHDELIDLLFSERKVQISEFITRKIYKYFVSPQVNEEAVVSLAKTFRDNNFEISILLKELFSSTLFFEEANISTIIPGHLEYFITFLNEIAYPTDDILLQYMIYAAEEYDQRLFNPTDVAGWQGNRNWINSSTLVLRWEGILNIMYYFYDKDGNMLETLRNFGLNLVNASESDPKIVVDKIIDYLIPKGFQSVKDYDEALKVFKAEVPENYFTSGKWNLSWEYAPAQILFLINHIANQPEFQLK